MSDTTSVFMVRCESDHEIHLFARAEDADAYAAMFLGAEATEETLLDAEWVEQQRDEIAADLA